MTPELPGAVPEIPVTDLPGASSYYQNNLGFTLDWADYDLAELAAFKPWNKRS